MRVNGSSLARAGWGLGMPAIIWAVWGARPPITDFDTFDCLTDRGLIRQEYERYLPLPRLGEGQGEALAVGSWIRPPPPGRYRVRPPQGEVAATL